MNAHSTLYALLRSALFDYIPSKKIFEGLSESDWNEIWRLSKEQGVGGVVAEALDKLPDGVVVPSQVKMKWIMSMLNVEKWYGRQYAAAADFAGYLAENNVSTLVLKGIAVSMYYPVPSHRECGDLDCFLGKDYEKGNMLAENVGAKVRRDYYKHSHIRYKGLEIENHQFCTGVRGSRLFKSFESHLRNVALKDGANYIRDSKLMMPSADFNALFLTAHGMTHFLTEGIKLRHICDWALLVGTDQERIDWKSFYVWCDRLHYTGFAEALTDISVRYLGLELNVPEIRMSSQYSERILNDCFMTQGLFNKGYSPWKSRMLSIWLRLKSLWKYHRIYRKSFTEVLLRQVSGFLFERRPRL